MHKEEGNSPELQPRGRMQDGGGGGGGGVSTQEEVNAAAPPTKRVRRPNVRLNQPYYVNAAHGCGRGPVQRRWDAFKKDLEGARKSKTRKTSNSKNGNFINAKGTKGSNHDNDDDDDDDMVIGSWKNLNSSKRNCGFDSKSKRKRAGPSNFKKRLSSESINKKDENFEVSNGSESENRRAGEEEEEENSGASGARMNLEVSSDNEKLPDGDNDYDGDNVVEKQGKLMSGDHDLVDGEEKNGVRVWLNELGLGKYANIFEFHEVDDAILPFLTFDDLKEMGIGAVGSRRKMYRSIQKLGQGFS
ncbi:hypothetical protein ABFS83_04G119100 [Erythranthe nasuta]